MLTLSNLGKPAGRKARKRLGKGEGSGLGQQSGRGHKGIKARSGGKVPAYFEGGQMPINRRLPKRGFKNPYRKNYRVLNLSRLVGLEETEFDISRLELLGLIPVKGKKGSYPVKVLASVSEEFTKTVHIKANAFSQRAIQLIEANGGKAEVV
ncbi:MAG TPA: 50S ribosomal protein L15 [Candidatus Syntrophosphaera sp.]|jgi:large subunit ribosomal protein L15|nr:50S ribosomal protein L15 [Candidatus Cloacimonadota bacterium]OQB92589.1 MAG: 50S ribosomal protein L15 [Candidatus Cloacimonetes bacterium ADurb.Bin117]HNU54246.1 50S ribosomal protein L15 [Candidatus Syntrophosphaera sp.]MDI9525063.1 50S ribosomal protein L15 [Candidatus Cloacimonadota bacterium]NLH93306.1 50S ribosomal protein L15 [Candidatus Cloacimonadota bacterium]